jgi:hypothetical protein
MKKRYESKWKGEGYYRIWRREGESLEVVTNFSWLSKKENVYAEEGFVYRKIELPEPPKPIIEFEPGLYRVKIKGYPNNWEYREKRDDGKSYNCNGWVCDDNFNTAYTAYQKLEPGEIIEVKK